LAGKTGSFLEDVRSWPSSCVVVMSMKFWPFCGSLLAESVERGV
jgi:hypothetical protein